MKNIHILPTDKPSRLYINTQEYIFEKQYSLSTDECQNKHIYITSDQEIKEGNWYMSILENEVYKATKEAQNIMSVANLIGTTTYKNTHFKIILTTDQKLIKEGVQAIDDEFLEWFVKNPSYEEVEIKSCIKTYEDGSTFDRMDYEIIIPKEEAKQETLEEAVQKVANSDDFINGALFGAKWQQEQIGNSEFLQKLRATISDAEARRLIFEQFKKK